MLLSFDDFRRNKETVSEMAQSKDEGKFGVPMDAEDKDFIDQAVAKGVSPVSALRTRYTLLLSDPNIGESGPVRFFGAGRKPFMTVNMERTHLNHLRKKLRSLGLNHAAEHGFHPRDEMDQADAGAYYNTAFGRQNASDILKRNADQWGNKEIDVNYGRRTGSAIKLSKDPIAPMKQTSIPGEDDVIQPGAAPQGIGPKSKARPEMVGDISAVTKPVPNNWSADYMKSLFQDKSRHADAASLIDLNELPGSRGAMYDFSDVWKAVSSLVGDTTQSGKHILPQVWELFQKALPRVGHAIFTGVRRKLKEFNPQTLESPLEIKQAMMQTTAMILSDPLRGNKKLKTGNFLQDVAALFANGKDLGNMAASLTAQGYVRKEAGISTNDAKRGGTGFKQAHDFDAMGQEDKDLGSDDQLLLQIQKLAPEAEVVREKLRKNNWDFEALSEDEFELLHHYEDLEKQLTLKRQEKGLTKDRNLGGDKGVRRGNLHPEQQKLDRVEAEIRNLEPRVKPIMDKLNASNWDTGRLSDEEWEVFSQHEKLEKELKRLKAMDKVDVDDLNLPSGDARFATAARNEVAGAGGTLGTLDMNHPDFQVEGDPCSQVILGFNAWCKNRKKLGDGTGHGKKKGWDGLS